MPVLLCVLPEIRLNGLTAIRLKKGGSGACLDWCFERWPNVRVDTHRDNKVMQHILTKYGFQRCGIIYVKNGTERIAYQMERVTDGTEKLV